MSSFKVKQNWKKNQQSSVKENTHTYTKLVKKLKVTWFTKHKHLNQIKWKIILVTKEKQKK